jgi:hypothetical protein
MIRVVHPGSGSRIRTLTFYPSRILDPGSSGQKGTGSRIRIRNTGSNIRVSYLFLLKKAFTLFLLYKVLRTSKSLHNPPKSAKIRKKFLPFYLTEICLRTNSLSNTELLVKVPHSCISTTIQNWPQSKVPMAQYSGKFFR